MDQRIVVIIGCGGMGLPVARRLGTGRRLLISDFSSNLLSDTHSALTNEGYSVESSLVDISDFDSVSKLAQTAANLGPIEAIVSTAGLSPSAGHAQRILDVNLKGTANVIDAFLPVAQRGTSLVCISSMAGHLGQGLPSELEKHLATAARDELMDHETLKINEADPHGAPKAYGLSKRGNILRVQGAASAWGQRGARVNSVSPGVISTEAGRQEIAGPAGKFIEPSPAGRVGNSQDIVNAVAFLVNPESSFITGTDILVDGGVVSMLRWDN
ncbi:hypothetical protein ACHAPJ_005252 [Fusarium lateritium]